MLLKRAVVDAVRNRYSAGSVLFTLLEFCMRFVQFVFGVAVIGLYAQDLVRSRNAGRGMDPEWLYATIVGSLASFSALVYIILPCILGRPIVLMRILHLPSFIHDVILAILWLTLFGMFGKKYIPVDNESEDKDVERMKHAVWIDVINLSFWMTTAAWMGLRWWKGRTQAKKGEKIPDQGGEVREV